MLLLIATLGSATAQAKVIQILHTNDLHAALNTAGEPEAGKPEYGGWAQIKWLMDDLTDRAAHPEKYGKVGVEPMETIRLDAGDFLEGTMLYFPDQGTNVLEAYNRMGWDASTLGNHDWLMGARGLDALLKRLPLRHPLVSANIKVSPDLKTLSRQLRPYTIIEKAGLKIGVFGLATTEIFYKWITKVRSKKKDMRIQDYYDREYRDEEGDLAYKPGITNRMIQELKPKTDAVIALTHIGFADDLAVVQETRGLDLVVGGHSHTFLETLNVETDLDGRGVPVVQTGYNGRMIGRITIEIVPGREPKVLTYELVPVPHSGPRDAPVAQATETANERVVSMYGHERLDEVIGSSEVRLVPGKYGQTAFSRFAVDSIRRSLDTPVGIDVGVFHSNTPLPGGVVTRYKLMQMYPRKFESDQNQGLYVYKARLPGLVLALAMKYAVKFGVYFSFSGMEYKEEILSDNEYARALQKAKPEDRKQLTRSRARDIRIDGKKICLTCVYDVAAPESIVRGAYAISPLTRLVVWSGQRSPVTIWQAMEQHLREIGTIRAIPDGQKRSTPRRNQYPEEIIHQMELADRGEDSTSLQLDSEESSPKEQWERFIDYVTHVKNANPKIDDKTDADSLED